MQVSRLSTMNVEPPFVKDMFDAIAPRYDLLNRLLSFRQDIYWRKVLVSTLLIPPKGRALDVACGTGDVLLELVHRKGSDMTAVGVDFSPAMLQLASRKISTVTSHSNISLLAGNALALPFRKETFDGVSIAFGIRNIADKANALRAFHRCLKAGGMLVVLELTTPPKGLLRSLYLFYFKRILPMIGGLISGDDQAYRYLPDSVIHFPESDAFAAIMREAGFAHVKYRRLTLGIATLYVGLKKGESSDKGSS